MGRISRVKELIEVLEQYPDNALITIHQGFKLVPVELVYLTKRNIVVFQEYKKEEKKDE